MMSLPFFGFTLAFVGILAGQRRLSIALLALSLIATLVLFKFHATDALAISL